MLRKLTVGLLLLTLIAAFWIPVTSAQNSATTTGNLNVRAMPNGQIVNRLTQGTTVLLEARNADASWVLVHTPDSAIRGWVAASFLTHGTDLMALPESTEQIAAAQQAAPPAQQSGGSVVVPSAARASIPALISTLERIPTLYNFNTNRVRQIYRTGLSLGNKPYVFTRVGDSLTSDQPFLLGFGPGGNYQLGAYGDLQATVEFFSQPIFAGDGTHSFSRRGFAASPAFTSLAVLDKQWTNPAICDPTLDSPLTCEYRTIQPSVAIILLGPTDIQIATIEQYIDGMQKVINASISAGVIPVLTTFSIPPDYLYYEQALRFNVALVGLAQRYSIPLINLWKEAQQLPDYGVGPDRYHLSMGDEASWYSFTGSETVYGVTLRNLLSLQALDLLRRNVLR